MFRAWIELAFDTLRLGSEVQEVMALRFMKLAMGGTAGQAEARLMVVEKSIAHAEAAFSLATGSSVHEVVQRYLTQVRANKERLSAPGEPELLAAKSFI